MDGSPAKLSGSGTVEQALFDLLIEGAALEALLMAAATLSGRALLLLDAQGAALAGAGVEPDTAAAWQAAFALAPHQADGALNLPVGGAAPPALAAPVTASRRTMGWLVGGAGACSAEDIQTLTRVCRPLALELLKREAVAVAQRGLQRDVLEALLEGRLASDDQVLREAYRAGWDLSCCGVILVVRQARGLSPADPRERPGALTQQVAGALRRLSPASIASDRGEECVVFVVAAAGPQPQRARELAFRLQADLEQRGVCGVLIGVGGEAARATGLAQSFRQAQQALRLRERLPAEPAVVSFEEVRVWVLLSDLADRPEARAWLEDQVGALIAYDRRNKTNLLQTLEVALDNGGLLNVTAEQLGIHPNTLKYRLQRIEELLAVSPFASELRLAFHLAARLARLLA